MKAGGCALKEGTYRVVTVAFNTDLFSETVIEYHLDHDTLQKMRVVRLI